MFALIFGDASGTAALVTAIVGGLTAMVAFLQSRRNNKAAEVAAHNAALAAGRKLDVDRFEAADRATGRMMDRMQKEIDSLQEQLIRCKAEFDAYVRLHP